MIKENLEYIKKYFPPEYQIYKKRFTTSSFKQDSTYKPGKIFIEMTNICNARCSTCLHRDMKRKQGIMEFRNFENIINYIADNEFSKQVELYGIGEPYIIPGNMKYFQYAIDILSKKNISTDIITNGSIVTDIPERMTGFFVISVNAGTTNTYKKITGLDFNKTLENIFRLNKSGQFKKNKVEIDMLAFEDNKNEIGNFLDLFKDTDAVLRIGFKYDNQCGKIKDQTLSEFTTSQRFLCDYAANCMNICWDGNIVLCPHDIDGEVIFGNCFSDSLRDVWNNEKRLNILKRQKDGFFDELCEKCNFNISFENKYIYFDKPERIGYIE